MNNNDQAFAGCIGVIIAWIFMVILAGCFWGGMIWLALALLQKYGVIG